jgi:hypothetical protein
MTNSNERPDKTGRTWGDRVVLQHGSVWLRMKVHIRQKLEDTGVKWKNN